MTIEQFILGFSGFAVIIITLIFRLVFSTLEHFEMIKRSTSALFLS